VKCRAKFLRDGRRLNSKAKATARSRRWFTVLRTAGIPRFEITNYSEHALSSGETAAAIAYIQIKTADGKSRWGAGVDTNIELASVRAVLSALNRL
jgi:2-isopropylmalate synthase